MMMADHTPLAYRAENTLPSLLITQMPTLRRYSGLSMTIRSARFCSNTDPPADVLGAWQQTLGDPRVVETVPGDRSGWTGCCANMHAHWCGIRAELENNDVLQQLLVECIVLQGVCCVGSSAQRV